MPYTTCLYFYLYCHHCLFYKKPVYISRVSQLHATQTQGQRLHVPQILIPPREMKAWAVIGFIIRGEMREFSWARKRNSVSSLAEGGPLVPPSPLPDPVSWGRCPLRLGCCQKMVLLSVVRLSMKFNLSSRYVQAGLAEHPPSTNKTKLNLIFWGY